MRDGNALYICGIVKGQRVPLLLSVHNPISPPSSNNPLKEVRAEVGFLVV